MSTDYSKNRKIILRDMELWTEQNKPITITLGAEVTEKNDEGERVNVSNPKDIIYVQAGDPTYGSLMSERDHRVGIYIYTPQNNFVGQELINFYVTDYNGNRSSTATVTINVGFEKQEQEQQEQQQEQKQQQQEPQPASTPVKIGPDGVQQIYPTAKDGIEFYLGDNPDKTKFNVSFGTGSHLKYEQNKEKNLTYFTTESVKVNYGSGGNGRTTRLDTYPLGGIWGNKTKYSWDNLPKDGDYIYKKEITGNEEYTTFIRTHKALGGGKHEAYAHKLAGRDEDDKRSIFEMVFATASHKQMTANWNYAHFPYVSAKPSIKFTPKPLTDEKWLGAKTVRFVAKDRKSSYWECYVDEDPFDSNGYVKNNWKLACTFVEKGCKQYKNKPCIWGCQKIVCRIDGHNIVDFALISWRQLEPLSTIGASNKTVQENLTSSEQEQSKPEEYEQKEAQPGETDEEMQERLAQNRKLRRGSGEEQTTVSEKANQ